MAGSESVYGSVTHCLIENAMEIPGALNRPRDQTNFVLNSNGKVKPVCLLSLMCMFPESNGTKF